MDKSKDNAMRTANGLEENLKNLVREMLNNFQLADDRLGVPGWSNMHKTFLDFCLTNNIISSEEFQECVESRISALGRKSYEGHINAEMPPDHTVSPQALAYAIRKGGLTDDEVGKIKFDHGNTRYDFFKGVEDTLPQNVMTQLSTH